ncbi:hypothetical protein NL676_009151 [Syzygium grande]|nr:hypothetical protein NL676_009151 [Syzygium grande]
MAPKGPSPRVQFQGGHGYFGHTRTRLLAGRDRKQRRGLEQRKRREHEAKNPPSLSSPRKTDGDGCSRGRGGGSLLGQVAFSWGGEDVALWFEAH